MENIINYAAFIFVEYHFIHKVNCYENNISLEIETLGKADQASILNNEWHTNTNNVYDSVRWFLKHL